MSFSAPAGSRPNLDLEKRVTNLEDRVTYLENLIKNAVGIPGSAAVTSNPPTAKMKQQHGGLENLNIVSNANIFYPSNLRPAANTLKKLVLNMGLKLSESKKEVNIIVGYGSGSRMDFIDLNLPNQIFVACVVGPVRISIVKYNPHVQFLVTDYFDDFVPENKGNMAEISKLRDIIQNL